MGHDLPLYRRGMILGKFMPPTQGHAFLCGFGMRCCQRLSILVCSKPSEPIPGACRFAWMHEMFPGCDVVHVPDDLPSAPEEHPQFWELWMPVIRRAVPEPIDVVFTSEDYGPELARRLDAEHLVVDRLRQAIPVSATAIRQDPYLHWQHIPPVVRPWFCRRVVIFGPESTGKTTMARRLAEHYSTVWVPEWARGHLDPHGGACTLADIDHIAIGQAAMEDALACQANRVLICDTDTLTTTIWSEVYFGSVAPWIRDLAAQRQHDLYLLCDIDVPWVDDQQRDMPHRREEFKARCLDALRSHHRSFILIRGSWDERISQAIAAINQILGPIHEAKEPAAQMRLRGECSWL